MKEHTLRHRSMSKNCENSLILQHSVPVYSPSSQADHRVISLAYIAFPPLISESRTLVANSIGPYSYHSGLNTVMSVFRLCYANYAMHLLTHQNAHLCIQ